MARTRFQKLEPEKREAILRAAAEEFAERGYQGASINRIIAASGMSKGAVYYYFEDKADLLATALETTAERIFAEAGWRSLEGIGAGEFWDTLLALTRRSVELTRANEWWLRLARSYHRLRGDPGAEAVTGKLLGMAREWWTALIARGQSLGVVRTDLPLELLVEIVMGADEGGDRWMMERWEELSEEELLRLVDARVDLLRDMLAKENEGWER